MRRYPMLQGVGVFGVDAIQDAAGRKIGNGGLSDESVEDMANSNLYVMQFL
ncbi:MAG TPA: hypothetical protein PLV19_02695 [Nitrosomonas sp.]|nr:hypothetical protein [Nitrosomonas sp.]HRB32749.1 hypothetical protein [Nitrosomonas sp.]HRB45148.1 hypothetical protein [Nitrosomonas sp.]HRB77311.1 hypothetical protein [Nitrosomonas sp.]